MWSQAGKYSLNVNVNKERLQKNCGFSDIVQKGGRGQEKGKI